MVPKPARYAFTITILIGLIVFGVIGIFSALAEVYQARLFDRLVLDALSAVIITLIISWLTLGTTPVVREVIKTFRVMTRLESLSHPLLLRLSREAPGTFHHSLQVGALASSAAGTIGADPLLARLGGYYHDIGKLNHPLYFIENQQRRTNPLDELTPQKAAAAIISHIDDGLKLAVAYDLPDEVVAIIAQHTGTTTVRFFLEKAKREGKKNIDEHEFQYPGPKPLSKEAGIVMLADILEAKMRLLSHPTHRVLSEVVRETLNEKLADEQLDLAGFSENDLHILQNVFTDSLETINHQRIAYPPITRSNQGR